jgi:transposase-like protein
VRGGGSWCVDETYIKVRGCWVYLFRAVDARGQTVDFRLSPTRDVAAAKAFFRKAFKTQGRVPRTITLDGYQASHRAVRELRAEDRKLRSITVRSCQYLNNIVEQDHRNIKSRLRPMLGFKQFENVASTIAGVELLHRIGKGQFALGRLCMSGKAAPEIWNAVLAA